MARQTGNALYVSFDGVVIDTLYRSFDPGTELEFVDVSAGGDALRVYAETLRSVAPTMTLINDTAEMGTSTTLIFNALTEGNEGSLVWGPFGTSAGMPKFGITAKVSKVNPSHTYDAEVEYEVEWQNTGSAFLFDGRTAVW